MIFTFLTISSLQKPSRAIKRQQQVCCEGNQHFLLILKVKIADFGLARVVENDQYNVTSQSSFPVRWSAPEVLTQHKISKASDVWSFGVHFTPCVSYTLQE